MVYMLVLKCRSYAHVLMNLAKRRGGIRVMGSERVRAEMYMMKGSSYSIAALAI
jgi:hypothetical protein